MFPIDESVIFVAADIYSILKKDGNIIGDADILIASIVLNNNGTLVSNNTKHFENIHNLNLVNWV